MSDTARLTVRMPTEERDALRQKAHALGISISDLVRAAVEEVQIGSKDEEGELRALVDLINLRIPETIKIIDQTHARIKKTFRNVRPTVKIAQPMLTASALALLADPPARPRPSFQRASVAGQPPTKPV